MKKVGASLYEVAMHALVVKGDEKGALRLKGLKKQATWRVDGEEARLVKCGTALNRGETL